MDILERFKNNKDIIIKKIDDFPYVIVFQETLSSIKEFMRYYPFIKDCKPYEAFPIIFDKVNIDEDLDQLLFDGETLLIGEEIIRFRINNRPNRSISESIIDPESAEAPRDGFIENIKANLALIRIRLRNNNLNIKEYMIGRRTKTRVYLLSVDDITDKRIVDKIDEKLKKIDVDTLLSTNTIKSEFNRGNLIPATHTTSSPDLVVSNLYEGQACILIDGVAIGILLPETIYFLTKEKGDLSNPFWYNLLIRIMVVVSIFASVNILGLFYSFIVYQRWFLPITIQDVLTNTESGVFLPYSGQILIMLAILEIYQFITIRSPKVSVNTIVVVIGGFLLSEKIIETKIVGAFILSVVAFSFIITFIISNDNVMIGFISYIRIMIFLSSMVLGIFGVTIANLLLFAFMYKKNYFRIYFMYPFVPLDLKEMKKMFISKSSKYAKTRPENLCHIDEVMK